MPSPWPVRSSFSPVVELLEDRLVLNHGLATPRSTTEVRTLRLLETGEASPRHLTAFQGSLYFLAMEEGMTRGLWEAQGEHLRLVKAFSTAQGAMAPSFPGAISSPLPVMGDNLYFVADDGTHGLEVWRSDGTAAGTVLVSDIAPGPAGSAPTGLTVVGDTLFFAADNGENGVELWKSDGTGLGTTLVTDLYAGWSHEPNYGDPNPYRPLRGRPNGAYPFLLTEFHGTLFFTATNGASGAQLWRSDGTAQGTSLVLDLSPGSPLFGSAAVDRLTPTGSVLYFTATTELGAPQLWKTDGTTLGTTLVTDFGTEASAWPITELTPIGDLLYFSAGDWPVGQELWRTDGTPEGTHLVKDIVPNPSSPGPDGEGFPHGAFPHALTPVGESLWFLAASPDEQHESLWVSDGSSDGTVMVAQLPGEVLAVSPEDQEMVAIGHRVTFVAEDGHGTPGVWQSDGTDDGTSLVVEAEAKPLRELAAVGNVVYAAGAEPQLWRIEAAPETAPPVPTTAADRNWLDRVYRDLLGRPIDDGGLAFWSGLLQQGIARHDVVLNIEASVECDTRVVRDLYQRHLRRAPDEGGLRYFVDLLQSNILTEEDVEASLLASTEYWQRRGSGNEQEFFRALFEDLMGTSPDESTRAELGSLLAFPDRTRVVQQILDRPDRERHHVNRYYRNFLNRDADGGGLDFFVQFRAGGHRDEEVIAHLLASEEYRREGRGR